MMVYLFIIFIKKSSILFCIIKDTNNFFPYSLEDILVRMNSISDTFSEKDKKDESISSRQELPIQSS